MGYTKTIEISIDSDDIARQISDTIAEDINDAIRKLLEEDGFPIGTIDDIIGDNDFWNHIIEDLMSQLKA